VNYDEKAAERLLKSKPNLARWHARANAVRTHEHCSLGLEHIELAIAEALERAYQDGKRDGAIAEALTALRGMLAQVEGIAGSMEARRRDLEREISDVIRAPKSLPVGDV
jgi:hypothetical protein